MNKNTRATFAILLLVLSVVLSAGIAAAQTETSAEEVQIKMTDGLEIKGSFYASASSDPASAVLLLHQLNGSRSEWGDFTTGLAEAGYNVLVVDQRGFGETGGTADWTLAQTDATALVDWLRGQSTVNPDKVSVIGASIGGNVALRVCASDPMCHTVIALSPGKDFMGVTTEDAVSDMADKTMFLAASQHDPYGSQDAVKALTGDAPDTVTVMTTVYAAGDEHATQMFIHPDLIPTMLEWLKNYAS